MRIRYINDLLLLNIVTVLLVIVLALAPVNVLRIVFGLPFVLFFPGYTLMALLFPGKSQLDILERLALSCVFSIVVVPLSAFILNLTPWGIRLYPVLIVVAVFILSTSLVAGYRRYKLVEAERFVVSFNLSPLSWKGKSLVDKTLYSILALVVLAAIGITGYALAVPRVGERYTEFYILGSEGKVGGYPGELVLGKEATVVVGIVNHEREEVSYRVAVTVDGTRNNEVGPVVLIPGGKWEGEVGFTPSRPGDSQKVEFILYKNGQDEPCLKPLFLWVNVMEHE